MSEFLFVYGTLRRDINSPMAELLAGDTVFVSQAMMQGRLYEVDHYPGVIESGGDDDKVFGEVYQILDAKALFAKLDDYEECSGRFAQPHEYVRKLLPVVLGNGVVLETWCYVYNHDTRGLERLISGDYLQHI